MHPKSLTEIANYYATDKGTIGPSHLWSPHNYTDVYEAYLERYRQSQINLLEIGLGVTGSKWDSKIVHGRNTGGASLKMWHEYFQNAKIFGLDVNKCSYLDNDRCKTFVGDQSHVGDLDSFMKAAKVEEFDVVVDDGSHRPDHQQISFSYFFKRLKGGGLYFIEDLLSNGHGDMAKGRMACESVKNTRSVFKYYFKYGVFPNPHALTDTEYLVSTIDYIGFHVPKVRLRYVFRPSLYRPLARVIEYKHDEPSLCVIKKRI